MFLLNAWKVDGTWAYLLSLYDSESGTGPCPESRLTSSSVDTYKSDFPLCTFLHSRDPDLGRSGPWNAEGRGVTPDLVVLDEVHSWTTRGP